VKASLPWLPARAARVSCGHFLLVLLASALLAWSATAEEQGESTPPDSALSVGVAAASNSFPVLLYKVDFEPPIHTAGAPPTLGEGAPPRRVPTRLRYGSPRVVAPADAGQSQVLELAGESDEYAQVSFALAHNLDTGGFETQYPTYRVELSVDIADAGTDASEFAIVLDGPMAQRIAFSPDGAITAAASWDPDTSAEGYRTEIGRFEVGVPTHVAIDLDLASGRWDIDLGRTSAFSGRYPTSCPTRLEGQCIRSLRLNAMGSTRAWVDDVAVMDHALAVDVRIRPDADTNVVAPHSSMLIQVALMGSQEVDTTRADLDSLALGPGEAEAWKIAQQYDVDEDGFVDLVVRFRASDTGVEDGDTELCLKGEIDEVPFYSCDVIRTPPPPPQRRHRKL
jgi:hypothetical protein